MRHILMTAAAGIMTLSGASLASAQGSCTANPCTVQVSASATVNEVLRLSLSSTTSNLGTPSEADYDAGYRDAGGPTATVKSNSPWHVDVVGAAANFSYSGPNADPNKFSTDLQWGTSAGTYGQNMGTSAPLFSGVTGTAGTSQAIFFRTLWSWASDVAGAYSLAINFTLAAP
ncbi:MAG TPA: hypothetical protein VF981_05005 [Gemmatimonadaceae bacterium]|jgi:hypothetical protein